MGPNSQLPPPQYPQQPPQVLPPPMPSGQPVPQQQNPMTYLDSIAAPTQTATMNPKLLWGLIGGVLLLVILVIAMVLNSGGPSISQQFSSYVYRVQSLQDTMKKSSKTIKNSELRALNSTSLSVLGTASQESSDVLPALDLKKLPPQPKTSKLKAEYAALTEKLDEANLNVRFDQTYAREVGYQIAKIRAELDSLYKRTNSKSVKAYLEKTDKNLEPLVDQFNDYNNSQT